MQSVKSQAFNPLQYSSFDNDTSEKFDEIVTKGGKKVFKVDIGHFDKLCSKFKDKSHLKIKNLKGRDKEDFNLMVSYVHLLHGTSYYDRLYEKVEKYFNDTENVKPGTVGGYFGGCLVSTSFDGDLGCSAVCAGSIPRPKDDEGWSFCDKAVIFGEYDKYKGYSFSVLKDAESDEDMDPCYLFVEHTDIHDFHGFTPKEKELLGQLGVEKVNLIGCDESGTKYIDLYSESRHLDEIKHRKYYKHETDNSRLGLALILIVIFLLLIVFFFGWRFWDKDYDLIFDHN
uniref:Uncharacterized protein n=1 Tax=Pithovirus LCPAC302 TaxID=2506593 RepID=A0A481Z7Y5_9VIRU|nr:MAG: uncharacterized protein LCPAC302_02150 [Pithovirus LCPAC302]